MNILLLLYAIVYNNVNRAKIFSLILIFNVRISLSTSIYKTDYKTFHIFIMRHYLKYTTQHVILY